MASNDKPKLIVILGPTSGGKSDLAVELARRHKGEVVSADSRQVYRGLDLGSGKITKKEMRGIPHHLLDVASPKRTFTVAGYKKLAERAIKDIVRRGRLPIIAGGTGLYIDSILYDQKFPAVRPDPRLRAILEKRSAADLFLELRKLDPRRAGTIDRHNKRRLVRALEIIHGTGQAVPEASPRKHSPLLAELGIGAKDVLKIGIAPGPEVLKKRIHDRLRKRMRAGLVAEVRNLRANGLSWKRLHDLGLEYRWVSYHLRGLMPKEEMLRLLEREIWHYARRQMTWWRKDKEIRWFETSPRPGQLLL